ncbi:MAG: DUF512 domain-containing protein [Lachnospiraceae bacterium]|nr:DUF512 domain-containing protein [Lachnospiraceae bacterium]
MADNTTSHTISEVIPDSPADMAGIRAGDVLRAAGGQELVDIFDYHYLTDEETVTLSVLRNGEAMDFTIEKEIGEDAGLLFENGLLDDYKSCRNACVFCFIDQMPPGMRETLYFKDDDTRLSFLQGNYVTLTNISDADLDRIIGYRLAPINVSVHATDPKLRCELLHNRFAGDVIEKMRKIADADLPMNAQIVLCKGMNDGAQLEKSIADLLTLQPQLESLSVVPVGLTKYREGLYPLEAFDRQDAKEVLSIIHKWQAHAYEHYGTHFVHASDEWYLLAGEDLPDEDSYDGYLQLENGVGMLRLLEEEFGEALEEQKKPLFMRKRKLSIATGRLAAPSLERLCQKASAKFPKLSVEVYPIRNDFFGELVTVSGLVTGRDLIAQLAGKELGKALLLPQNMLRAGEEVFLDDVTVSDVCDALHLPVYIVKSDGKSLLDALLGVRGHG